MPHLEVKGLVFRYEDMAMRFDLVVERGTFLSIVGPSGAGKTTLLHALARLLPGAHGSLALDGRPAEAYLPQEWRCLVALVPQRATLVPGAVADNLLLPFAFKVRSARKGPHLDTSVPTAEETRAALDGVGLADVDPARDVGRLSVGQAARVALLRTLLTRPRVLLLDEPDASLDDESAALVTQATRAFIAEGGAAVRVRHLRSDALADRRFKLSGGRLAEVTS